MGIDRFVTWTSWWMNWQRARLATGIRTLGGKLISLHLDFAFLSTLQEDRF